jgi:hypothetical protein
MFNGVARRGGRFDSRKALKNPNVKEFMMQTTKHIGIPRGRYASVTLFLALAGIFGLFATPSADGQVAKPDVPKEKQTTLGLYVTAAQAYEMCKAAPDKVKVIDVQYAFIGHPRNALNIPLAFVTYQRKDGKKRNTARR